MKFPLRRENRESAAIGGTPRTLPTTGALLLVDATMPYSSTSATRQMRCASGSGANHALITLGIYRFWATTRVRRWFWSKVTIDGERLEYSGTGFELLILFTA
jgi:Bacterial protein of unknown function (DUF898)